MSREALIAAIEKRNELRARQHKLSGDEMRYAKLAQECIRTQADLEDRIISWEIEIAALRSQLTLKQSEGSWLLKKLGL